MPQKNDDPQQSTGINRRSVLEYSAGIGLTAVGHSGVVAASHQTGSDVYRASGTKSSPLTWDQMVEVRQSALDDFEDRGGDLADVNYVAKPGNFKGSVVEYVCSVSREGVPLQYGGIVGADTTPERIRTRASSRAGAFANDDVSADGVSTQGASWEWIDHDEWDYVDCPYGIVTNNWDLAKLQESQDPDQDAYAMDHWFALDPGTRACSDSHWENNRGYPKHDWADGSMGGEDLDEWDPNTDLSGSQSVDVTVGTGGASLSWTYAMEDYELTDLSEPTNNFARWKQAFGYGVDSELITTEPGSSCWVNEGSCDKLLEVEGYSRWVCRYSYDKDYHWTTPKWSYIDSC